VLLLIVVLLKLSAYYTSNRAISSSVREASEMLPIVVDAIVIRILVVVGFLFTKKRRIWEFEKLYGGVRRRPNRANE
jgi:hypothetical protein